MLASLDNWNCCQRLLCIIMGLAKGICKKHQNELNYLCLVAFAHNEAVYFLINFAFTFLKFLIGKYDNISHKDDNVTAVLRYSSI